MPKFIQQKNSQGSGSDSVPTLFPTVLCHTWSSDSFSQNTLSLFSKTHFPQDQILSDPQGPHNLTTASLPNFTIASTNFLLFRMNSTSLLLIQRILIHSAPQTQHGLHLSNHLNPAYGSRPGFRHTSSIKIFSTSRIPPSRLSSLKSQTLLSVPLTWYVTILLEYYLIYKHLNLTVNSKNQGS